MITSEYLELNKITVYSVDGEPVSEWKKAELNRYEVYDYNVGRVYYGLPSNALALQIAKAYAYDLLAKD